MMACVGQSFARVAASAPQFVGAGQGFVRSTPVAMSNVVHRCATRVSAGGAAWLRPVRMSPRQLCTEPLTRCVLPHARLADGQLARLFGVATRQYTRRSTQHLHPHVPKVPFRAALLHGLAAAIPMIGFGFMDNVVLIVAGSNIDYYFGTSLGIHTMTAAGLGQVVSDTSGVLFGQLIENVAQAIGLPKSGLSPSQIATTRVRMIRTACMAIGVITGCLLGMSTIMLVDVEKRDREEKIKQLEPLMRSIVDSCNKLIRAEHCHLWLIDANDPRYLWSRGIASVPPRPENLRAAFNHIRDGNDGVTATQLYSAIEKFGRETNVQKVEESLKKIEKEEESSARCYVKETDLNSDRCFSFQVFAEYMRREVSAGLHVRIKLREGGFKSAVIEGKKTLMKDVDYNDPRMNKAHNLVTGLRTRNVLVSPIISEETGKVIGLIEMANKLDNRSFTKADVKLVELMAKHAAIFIEK